MRIPSLLPIMAIFLFSLAGCQKEYNPTDAPLPGGTGGGTGGTVTGNFKAKINGVQWVADKAAEAVIAQGIINLTGISLDGRFLTITLTDSGAHTYTLDQSSINAAAYSESANSFAFTSNAADDPNLSGGICTISSIDTVAKKISGNFKFKLFRETDSLSRDITEGSFTNITYTNNAIPGQTNTTDSFRVKLDGVDWVNYSVFAVNSPLLGKIGITSNRDANASATIGFQLDNTIAPGSYVWDLATVSGLYNPPDYATVGSLVADGGNLTILENNPTTKRIRGTFNFSAAPLATPTPVVNFTQGYFSVVYQ